MKTYTILKAVVIGLFLILTAGKYFGFIENYQITDNFSLYDTSYIFLAVYLIIRISEFISNRKKTSNE